MFQPVPGQYDGTVRLICMWLEVHAQCNNFYNLRKEMYYYYNVYVIKKIVELASKSPWLTVKASRHESKGKPKVCGSRLTR